MNRSGEKKAVIVGGSNGIGLAIAGNLIEKGYFAVILDRCEPAQGDLKEDAYTWQFCDLLDFDQQLFEELSKDSAVEVLMITAGIGRVADFEYIHTAELENIMKINAVENLKILRIFYDRIKCEDRFYCGVMGSIAGLVSSPMFSVYAASKAAVCRLIESVNIELEEAGVANRILNVSPGSIRGTKFNGGENDMSLTAGLAEEIVAHMFHADELFIPQYEEIYKGVLARYHNDAHEYGLHSYKYKKDSGRVQNENKVRIGYLSGTFDLFHVGHLNLLQRARKYCDYLIVGVHRDASHKGKETFIPFEERMRIVGACRYVDQVVESCREDSDAWDKYHYHRLFVGSDYKGTERFRAYEEYFQDKDVEIIYFPYTQGTSSTQLRSTLSGAKEEK